MFHKMNCIFIFAFPDLNFFLYGTTCHFHEWSKKTEFPNVHHLPIKKKTMLYVSLPKRKKCFKVLRQHLPPLIH